MKVLKANNDRLKAALSTRDDDIQAMLEYMEIKQNQYDNEQDQYDDEQLQMVKNYQKLTQFQKDLLYLTIGHPVSEIADMYQVSKTHIYETLKKIKIKLCQNQ